ncbi:MAG: response regulator [Rubrivivax sp.]|nr:response regulator [Rubrivivax sp.]
MGGPRVLIVDDNAMNIALAQTVLLADGFEVAVAADAAAALQQVAAFQPDLILMDIQMPGMDGLDLTRALKADPATRPIRIVAFTAFAMRGDEARMRAAGCDAYLSKPIEVRRFGAQVRACLGPSAGPGQDVFKKAD